MSTTGSEGSGPETGRLAATQAWEASTLAAPWYPRPNDLIGGWCVMPSNEPPSSGGPEVADFCTERLARYIAELHNASLDGDQVTVSRAELRSILRDAIRACEADAAEGDPEAPDFLAEHQAWLARLAGDPQ